MSPIDWATLPLKKYADFSGRAPRAEYWWFYLLMIVTFVVSSIIDSLMGSNMGGTGYGLVSLVVGLGLIIPSLAAGVRRLHDTDRSGWWLLIGLIPFIGAIVLIIFFVTGGTSGDNRYGPDPYGA